MKLNKTIGRVATTLVATAMLASLAAPAYAETPIASGKTLQFVKSLNMSDAEKASVPTATYSYEVEGVSPAGTADSKLPVMAGVGTPEIEDAVFSVADIDGSTGDDDKNENDVITKNLDVTFTSVTYTKPGIYRYKVTETDPEGFTFTDTSDNTFYMDVYVERTTSGFQVSGVVFMKNNGTMPEFVAGEDEEPDVANYGEGKMSGDVDTYTTYTLEINKKVAGALADAGDTYNFDVTFTGLPEDTYLTIDDSKYATAADESGELNVTNSISIVPGPNGNSVIIYGIPSSASYDVIENLLSSEGYTVTAKINDTPVTVEANGQGTAYHTGTVALKGENDSKIDDVVEITNTREAVTPTGIVMNVAPYALLVVIAAAGCFVFLRKRRED